MNFKNNEKVIRSWAFFDWANSAYSLLITSTVFPAYYTSLTSDNDSQNIDYVKFNQQDRVSAKGFVYGYAGSIILQLICFCFLFSPGFFGLSDTAQAARLSFLLVGIWWMLFALLTFKNLPDGKANPAKSTSGVYIAAYYVRTETHFYYLAAISGLIMGGVQSLSRSTYAKFLPQESPDHTSFFSFYDVTEKVALVIGMFSFGYIEEFTGSLRNSSIALAAFFVLGLLFLVLLGEAEPEKLETAII